MLDQLAHHHARHPRAVRLHVLRVDAVIADHRRRHDHQLAQVGGIGEHLLVAAQIGGEDDLGAGGLELERRGSGEAGAILQEHVRRQSVSDWAS